jgi:protein-disulfide isomerase
MSLLARLEQAATIVLATCAIAVTGLLARRELRAPPDPSKPKEIKEWRQYAVGDMSDGPATAPVTITEFADYQCPFCKKLHAALQDVRTKHGPVFRLVYRNLPIPQLHPYAKAAAIAAECAAASGQFAGYHDFLYSHQDSIGRLTWNAVASRVGVKDTVAFAACLRDERVKARLGADSLAAKALNIGGTPAILINRWLFYGVPSQEDLEKYIVQEARSAATR